MQVVLVRPQIPPNTGNVARTCAATGTPLHLVAPLGFEISDRRLKRAGLDYWDHVQIHHHGSLDEFLEVTPRQHCCFFSKSAERPLWEATFSDSDYLIFGNETEGLPEQLRTQYRHRFFRIPMSQSAVRSLNLASAVAVVLYEALRQTRPPHQ